MLIGVTGSIASGKSTFCNILRDFGYMVIDCDEISHDVIKKGRVAYYEVIYEFGEDILNQEKEIDRKLLGAVVFNDLNKLKKLEAIIHPKVLKEIKKYKKETICFFEVPLLFEAHWENAFDRIVCIASDFNIELKRLMERNNLTPSQAIDLIFTQIPIKEKIARSDYVIYNNGTNFELEKEAKDFIEQIVNDIRS